MSADPAKRPSVILMRPAADRQRAVRVLAMSMAAYRNDSPNPPTVEEVTTAVPAAERALKSLLAALRIEIGEFEKTPLPDH